MQSVYERAAELLVLNIKWLKALPCISGGLEKFEQLQVVRNSWKELFLLSAIQDGLPMNLNELLNSFGLNGLLDKLNGQTNGHDKNDKNDKNDKTDSQPSRIKSERECSSPPSKKFMNNDKAAELKRPIDEPITDSQTNNQISNQSNNQLNSQTNSQMNSQNSQTNLSDGKLKKDSKAANGIRSIMSILTNDERTDKSNGNSLANIDSVMMNFLNEVKSFHQLIVTAKEFSIDAEELFWLKLVCLFRVNGDGQVNASKFTALQEHSQLMLGLCVARKLHAEPNAQTIRLGQLTFVLSLLGSISESTVESLFFRKTIGNLSVVNLIQDLFNSSHLESFS